MYIHIMYILANIRIFYSQKKNEERIVCFFLLNYRLCINTASSIRKNLALHEFFWLMFAIKILNMIEN